MHNNIPLKDRIFDYINGVLFVTEKCLAESGLSVAYYRKEKSSGSKRLNFIDHPDDKRYSLLQYETISDQHKEKIKARFKNPYDFIAKVPILNMIAPNDAARKFFIDYRFNNKPLPLRRVNQFTRACEWLQMLLNVNDTKNKAIKDIGLKVPEFFDHVKQIMDIEKANGLSDTYDGRHELPGDFPATYQNLLRKRDDYKTRGFELLLDKFERMSGNKIAAKVFDEIAEAQLMQLLNDGRQFDDTTVALLYSTWASANGYPTLSPRTICEWRKKKAFAITIGREGNSAFNERFIRQVKGQRPSAPLYLVENDDNSLDFLFQDKEGYQFSKYYSIVITDSFNDYVLGKSYILGRSPIVEQVHHAYLDAMYNIRRLTGGWYLPFEIKADMWAKAQLPAFYNKIAHFIPPAHGNKHRGYIEPFFGSPHWKRCQQLVSTGNWSGNNMGAKFRGVNPDMLDASLKDKSRPQIGVQAEQQIEDFFHLLRNMPAIKKDGPLNAPSKEQEWLTAFNALPVAQKRPINDEQFLLLFGVKHQPQGRTIRITNRGIEPQIGGTQYSFDLPEAWMYNEYNGEEINVWYDPFDMSRVLVTNENNIRFIAKSATLVPRALQDHYTGSRTYLNAILNEKKDQVATAGAITEKTKKLAKLTNYNAEGMLQGGVLLKEEKNDAEQKYLEQQGESNEQYLDDNYDLNEYFKTA